MWDNSTSVNQQFAFVQSYRDHATQQILYTTLANGWGGIATDVFSELNVFNSMNTFTSPSSAAYPFNNIRDVITSDGSVYYTRSSASTDVSQVNRLLFYNYQKSYPLTLLGDRSEMQPFGGGVGVCV